VRDFILDLIKCRQDSGKIFPRGYRNGAENNFFPKPALALKYRFSFQIIPRRKNAREQIKDADPTFHHIPNNGAFLFVYSLTKVLQREFNKFEINVLDYKSSRLAIHEYLKRFKVFQGIPLFYMNRARLWEGQVKTYLDLDRTIPHFASDKKCSIILKIIIICSIVVF
jgi:hypothetical protein